MKTVAEVKGALQAALDGNANWRETMVETIKLLERLQSHEHAVETILAPFAEAEGEDVTGFLMKRGYRLFSTQPAGEPTRLTVPLHKLERGEFMSLHQSMLSIDEDVGEVATGAGLGNDAIWLKWKGTVVYVRGAELLRALVRQVDPAVADAFPADVEEVSP